MTGRPEPGWVPPPTSQTLTVQGSWCCGRRKSIWVRLWARLKVAPKLMLEARQSWGVMISSAAMSGRMSRPARVETASRVCSRTWAVLLAQSMVPALRLGVGTRT